MLIQTCLKENSTCNQQITLDYADKTISYVKKCREAELSKEAVSKIAKIISEETQDINVETQDNE